MNSVLIASMPTTAAWMSAWSGRDKNSKCSLTPPHWALATDDGETWDNANTCTAIANVTPRTTEGITYHSTMEQPTLNKRYVRWGLQEGAAPEFGFAELGFGASGGWGEKEEDEDTGIDEVLGPPFGGPNASDDKDDRDTGRLGNGGLVPADVGAGRLRMYGVWYEQIETALGKVRVAYADGTEGEDVASYVGYVDSDENGDFILDPDDTTTVQYWYTSVPSLREVYDWEVERVDYMNNWMGGTLIFADTSVSTEDLIIFYKDPHVCPVPEVVGGGWLMLLGRVRIRRSDAEAYADEHGLYHPGDGALDVILAARRMEAAGPGLMISDIVAYWSPTQAFTDPDLVGPFLIVDSLRGVGTVQLSFRVWLGAPTGAFVYEDGDWWLHVYANAEVPVAPNGDTFDGEDVSPLLEYIGFEGGIAHLRVSISNMRVTDAYPFTTAEDTWTADDAWAETPEDPELNLVQLWMWESGGTSTVKLLTEAIAEAVDANVSDADAPEPGRINPELADPAVVTVEEDEGSLYFHIAVGTTRYDDGGGFNTELTNAGNTLFGLWRSVSLPAGYALPDSSAAIFGRDFVVGHGASDSEDLIAPAYVDGSSLEHQFLDPDPVLYGSRWRVYTREQFGNRETPPSDEHEFYTRPA